MNLNGLSIILTDKCSMSCESCNGNCSPTNENVMSREMMLEAIMQANEVGTIKNICFAGGDPFLFADLMREGIHKVHQKGMKATILTNGSFGSYGKVKCKELLQEQMPDDIELYYDSFHAKFVSQEAIQNVYEAAMQLKINIHTYIGETNREKASDFYKSLGDFKYLKLFTIYPVMRLGRAESIADEDIFRFMDSGSLYCKATEMGNPALRYDGKLFPCYQQAMSGDNFSFGNIGESTLKELVINTPVAKLMGKMHISEEFQNLLNSGKKSNIIFPNPCTNECELCNMLFQKKNALDLIDEVYKNLTVGDI